MAVRTLKQINKELGSIYDPQTQLLQRKQQGVQGQVQADIEAAKGQKNMAFDDILGGARQRGLGFAGIPLGEQAKYASNVFAPSVLAAQQSGRDRAMSLEEALLGIGERRSTLARTLRQQDVSNNQWERTFAEEKRRFDAQLAESRRAAAAARAQSAGLAGLFNSGAGAGATKNAAAAMARKQDGGFAFADAKGNPISAASYAQATNQDIRDVLYDMGSAGDTYAKQLYNQLSGDRFFGRGNAQYDQQIFQTYSPIFWDLIQGGSGGGGQRGNLRGVAQASNPRPQRVGIF